MSERARLTVVEQVSMQEPGKPVPTVADSRFGREAQSAEQPYVRTMTVGEEWVRLDLGWVKECGCGMLCLKCERRAWPSKPTEDERRAADAAVVDVEFSELKFGSDGKSVGDPDVVIQPGESCRFQPGHLEIFVRCRNGEARLTATAFPV